MHLTEFFGCAKISPPATRVERAAHASRDNLDQLFVMSPSRKNQFFIKNVTENFHWFIRCKEQFCLNLGVARGVHKGRVHVTQLRITCGALENTFASKHD